MKKALIISLLFFSFACKQSEKQEVSFDNNKSIMTKKVDALLKKMTIEEKVGQMNQYSGFMDFTGPQPKAGEPAQKLEDIKKGRVGAMLNVHGVENVMAVQKIAVEESRLGIPLLFGYDVIHGYKTISPIPLAEAASWNLDLIKRSAEIAAQEASASGINWTFAPMVDISRDARWGRVMEGAGEDPYLASLIAEARVKGFQGNQLNAPNTIAACAKHFSGYGFAEAGKEYNTVDVSQFTLHNIINPPFKAAVNADVKTFMSAFNLLNGIPATGNAYLHRDLLKDQWGFEGFVVSDWASVVELVEHGFAKDEQMAAKLAVEAGNDMDMESSSYLNHLINLVEEGVIKEELINDAVRRILQLKFELGLFDNPYLYCDEEREKKTIKSPSFKKDIQQLAKESIVLLKNENQLLPLSKEKKHIAVIGDLVDDKTSVLGSWRLAADEESAVSLKEALINYDADVEFSFHRGVKLIEGASIFSKTLKVNTSNYDGLSEAVEAAKKADKVIMMLGEHGLQSGEARSRTSIGLPGLQQEMLEAIYKVNPNIILVLQNGRPLSINWAQEHIPAIVEAWHLGTFSGSAIAEVLFGDYNPSGKLPMTFPKNVGQIPMYYNHFSTGRPEQIEEDQVFWAHYSDVDNLPLYPFGYGLSYTEFTYANQVIELVNDDTEYVVKVNVDVKNTGKYSGKETVQLYINQPVAQVARPVKELKAFKQIKLSPNETRTLSFKFTKEDLSYYLPNGRLHFSEGLFNFYIGTNAQEVLKKSIELM